MRSLSKKGSRLEMTRSELKIRMAYLHVICKTLISKNPLGAYYSHR